MGASMEHIKTFCPIPWLGLSGFYHLPIAAFSCVVLLCTIVFWVLCGTYNAVAADVNSSSAQPNGIERVEIDCPIYDFYKYSGTNTLSNELEKIIFYDNYNCLIKSRSEMARSIYSLMKEKKFKSLDEAENYLPRLYKSKKHSSIVINPYYTPCAGDENLIQCESNIVIGYCKKNSPSEFDGHYCALDQRTFMFRFYADVNNTFYIDEVRPLTGDNDLASRYTRIKGVNK